MSDDPVETERQRRMEMWGELIRRGGPNGVTAGITNELRMMRGGRGVYLDLDATSGIASDGGGVAVGVLHTGRSYPDDLSEDSMVYHYPTTKQPGRDRVEVAGLKAAGSLRLPVFARVPSLTHRGSEDVRLGFVEDFDDESRLVLIAFGASPESDDSPATEDPPFELTSVRKRTRAERNLTDRSGQPRFKFELLKRYGAHCAMCDNPVPLLLDAAHIRPVEDDGSDDPRNGLVLCATHHRAFDRQLVGIDPTSHNWVASPSIPSLGAVGVTTEGLDHLERKPHHEALLWRWSNMPLDS